MIYTADKFAAHLTARGATVTTSEDGPLTVVGANYNGVRAYAWFRTGGRFQDAVIHPDKRTGKESASLLQVVEAFGLPVPATAGRV